MRILFLDDNPSRAKFIRGMKQKGQLIAWVQTVKDCIQALMIDKWDIVMLDHDLGMFDPDSHKLINMPAESTGMDVVRYLEENKLEIPRITVHSTNASAAPVMAERLRAAGYRATWKPFTSIYSEYNGL